MSCIYEYQSGDYVDGTLESADREVFESHLPTCATCRAMIQDFRAINATAATLERRTPPPALWYRIEAAVDSAERRRWTRLLLPAWKPLMVAASVFVVVAMTWLGWQQLSPAQRPASAAGGVPTPLPESIETELRLAEEHYQKAITGLEQITSTQSGELDAQTSAVLQNNLLVIDQAIGESRAALVSEPASNVAQESLFEALRSKVGLLQNTVALINEMRKGNQEEAARIVSGLNQ